MAIEYFDGWDAAYDNTSLALRGWAGISGTFASATGRNSQGFSLKNTTGGVWEMHRELPGGNLASRVIGLAMNQRFYDGNNAVIGLSDGATNQIAIARNGSGQLLVQRNGTTLGTSAVIWSVGDLGVWKYVELVSTINNSTGSYELFVDGVSVLSGTGIDTQTSANAYANRLYLYGYANDQWRFDDLYIGTTRLGDRRVILLPVTSDDSVAWTRSAGATNFGTVDDVPLSATDYNEATAASLKDQFGVTDLSFTPTGISALAVGYVHTKTDSGARTMRGGIVSGGTTGNGTTVSPVLSTQTFRQDIWETDPNTSAAWTKSGVDAVKAFYETVT